MKIIFCNIPDKPVGLWSAIISPDSPSGTLTAELTRRIKALDIGIEYVCYQAHKAFDQGLLFWDSERFPSDRGLFLQAVPNLTENFGEDTQRKCEALNRCINDFFLERFPKLLQLAEGVDVEILPPQWIGLNGKQLGV